MSPEDDPQQGHDPNSLINHLPEVVRSAASHIVGLVNSSEVRVREAIDSPTAAIDSIRSDIGKLATWGRHMIQPSIILGEVQRRVRGKPDNEQE